MSGSQSRPVEKVAEWATGSADLMQEPILMIRTLEGGDYAFQMPVLAAEALARSLLAEAARLSAGPAH